MSHDHFDWNAKLVRFFLQNKRLVWLILITLTIGGIFSLSILRREGFPQVTAPVLVVQTVYPGAASQEVESAVTKPIEDSIKDVKNLKEVSSTSVNSFSSVVVRFEESANLDTALQDVQTKVQSARSQLPQDAEQSKVASFSTGGPAFILGVTSGGDLAVSRADALKLSAELSNVSGVKSAKPLSEVTDRVVVSYRPADLTANGVALTQLTQLLQAANVNFPVGTITSGDQQQNVLTVGQFTDLNQIENLVVGFNAKSKTPILLKNVATVTREAKSKDLVQRFGYTKDDGSVVDAPGVLLQLEVTNTADIISTKNAIEDRIATVKKDGSVPSDLTVRFLYDQGQSTKQQVDEILGAAIGNRSNLWLLGGLQLLFVAMLLFVNPRAAFVSALAIPLSFGFTFIALALTGTQLNTIVLFSLILVLGLIVDPAIVMVEAIQRYRDINYTAEKAVLESGRRYGAALFMAVLTSLIVFLPFGVVSGVFGQIIKYIPITVLPALVASYLVPIALLPMISEKLLKGRAKHVVDEKDGTAELNSAARFVMKINARILEKRWRQVGVLILSLILVGLSVSLVASGNVQIVQFSTPEDNELLQLSTSFKSGTTEVVRDAASKKIEDAVAADPSVKEFYYLQQGDTNMLLYINLKPKGERKDATLKSKQVVARLEGLAATTGLSDFRVNEVSSGTPESDYQIKTQLYDNDFAKLEKAAKDVGQYLAGLDHVVKVDDGFTGRGTPEIQIVLDRDKLARAGLSSFEVGAQLKSIVSDTTAGKFENPTTQKSEDIVVRAAATPQNIDAIKNLPLTARTGATVRVGDVATVATTTTIDAIQRFNGQRFVDVAARLDDSKNTIAVQQKLDQYLTPEKLKEYGIDSRQNRGDFEDIANSFQELFIALAVAIVLTYVVLVLQFKSFSQPAIMLFTVPLSLIGVFPALALTGSDLGFLELLGVTILVGIVENVAIFLIDYANQLIKEKGLSPKEAIIQASGVRFRPILLTKLVALGGLLPLAIESDFWRGLSVVIMAGIGLSGFFSLVVIPVLYVWIAKLRAKIHHKAA